MAKDYKLDSIQMQVGNAEAVTNLATADFVPTTSTPFLIKNDGTDAVTLEVKYANGTDWISTKFQVGWNPDVVKAIKTNATAGITLLRSI